MADMHELGFTAEDVKNLREQLGVGILEAKDILTQQALVRKCNEAQSIDDLKFILHYILARY